MTLVEPVAYIEAKDLARLDPNANKGGLAQTARVWSNQDMTGELVALYPASTIERLEQERDEARETAVRWGKSGQEQFIRAERAEAERDALAKALEPFAATAEVDIGETETDDDVFQQATYNRAPQITVGHFRRARTASQALKGDKQ